MIKTILLLLLTTCILGLHLPNVYNHDSVSLDHSEQGDKLQYVAYFNNSFLTIQTRVDYVKRTLEMNNTGPEQFKYLIARCEEILVGLRVLQSSLLKYNLLISESNKFCPKISTFNRTQIRRFIVYIQQKQFLISSYYPTCSKCAFIIPDLNQILQSLNKYFKLVNRTLDGQYCKYSLNQKPQGLVNLNSSYFKNNLKADNWYYGDTTQSDYKIYIFKRLSSYNMTDCPLDRPFVKESLQVCFDCPPGSLFNVGKQECTICAKNQYFDIVTNVCKECLGKKKIVNGTVTCQPCLMSESEFFNSTSGQCYKCDTKTSYVDLQSQTCRLISCPASTPRFNKYAQSCERCQEGFVIDAKDVTSCIKTNYIGLCPTNKPIYFQQTRECGSCPQGTIYNKDLKLCEANLTYVSQP